MPTDAELPKLEKKDKDGNKDDATEDKKESGAKAKKEEGSDDKGGEGEEEVEAGGDEAGEDGEAEEEAGGDAPDITTRRVSMAPDQNCGGFQNRSGVCTVL